ncbi:Ran GAP Rna1 [Glugoides intestinalis]
MLYKISTEFEKYSTIDSISGVLDELNENKEQITILDLSFNTFVPEVFSEIAKAIKAMKSLKHVKLESIFDSLTYEEMCNVLIVLCEALPRNLISFELPSNALSCNFPEEFGKFLQETPVKVLNLHNCGLGEDGLKRIVCYLEKLENKENLTVLDFSKNRINVICDEFAPLLSSFENVTDFILYANTIEEKSMADFLGKIENKNLTVLNLTDNFVCGEAMESLAKVFSTNKIKELYLQDIKVDEGDIKKALKALNSFKEKRSSEEEGIDKPEIVLDISCNYFEQDCIEILEELAQSYKFKKLVIFDNNYEDVEKLKGLVLLDNGCIIDEEEEEIEEIDSELLEKFSIL